VTPYLYLLLPLWTAAALLGLAFGSVFYVIGEPVLRTRWVIWAGMLLLLAVDVGRRALMCGGVRWYGARRGGVMRSGWRAWSPVSAGTIYAPYRSAAKGTSGHRLDGAFSSQPLAAHPWI
jgi:hypothetical protein